MFTDKKAAEEHDRTLELADGTTAMPEGNFKIGEQLAEEIDLLMSRKKDILAKALKGKPGVLQEINLENMITILPTLFIHRLCM